MGLESFDKSNLKNLPIDWDVKTLGEISRVSSGKRLPKGESLISSQNLHPYIRVTDMKSLGVDKKNVKYVPDHLVDKIKSYRIYKDELYISVAGTLGLVGIIDINFDGANLTENANRIYDLKINEKYLLYFLQSKYIKDIINNLSTTGAQPKLALTRIRKFNIFFPKNLKDQKKIVNKLNDIDKLLSIYSKIVRKKNNLNNSLIKLLVTGKKRLNNFNEKWIDTTLGNILDYEQPIKYISKKKEYNASGLTPILTANKSFILGYTNEKDSVFDNPPVIIFDDFTTDLKFVSFNFKVRSSALKILIPKNKNIDVFFLYNLMKHINFPAIEHKRYWIAEFQYLKILMPSYDEQKKIATIIRIAQDEIDLINQKILKLKKIKSSMMEQLLTAKHKLI